MAESYWGEEGIGNTQSQRCIREQMVARGRKGASQLCRKVLKHRRFPSQCKHAGLSGTTEWQVEALPSVTWNLQHSWGDSGMEEGVHWTRHSMWAGHLVTNVNGPLPTSSQKGMLRQCRMIIKMREVTLRYALRLHLFGLEVCSLLENCLIPSVNLWFHSNWVLRQSKRANCAWW